MKQSLFESRHQGEWDRLSRQLDQLERSRNVPQSSDFPPAYRRLCHHLALAQARGYSSLLVDTLQQLALRGHQQLYRDRSRPSTSLSTFILAGFPRLVREQWRFVLAAGAMFMASLIGIGLLVYLFPELVYSLLSVEEVSQIRDMYDPASGHLGRSIERAASQDWVMFGYYIMHNIGIAFQTFASGLMFGTFWSFVIGHGAFELTAITLAGAAGLQLGWALIAPGRLTRGEALRIAAGKSVLMVGGVMLLLLIAAFIEAYWSSSAVTAATKYTVGALLWLLVISYLLFAGRARHASE